MLLAPKVCPRIRECSIKVLSMCPPLRKLVATLLFTLVGQAPASGRTWSVSVNGQGDAATVAAALDSAQAGDEVVLAPGTYDMVLHAPSGYRLKAGVALRSASGSESTVLDLSGGSAVATLLCENVGSNARIEGLTFSDLYVGPAILVSGDSDPTISRCRFQATVSPSQGIVCDVATIEGCEFIGLDTWAGAAIQCGAARINDCVFRGNQAQAACGAISSSSAHIRNCIFENNSAGGDLTGSGGAVCDGGNLTIEGCSFMGNSAMAGHTDAVGGALYFRSGTVRDCLFVDNAAIGSVARGGAIYVYTTASIEGCLFIRNRSASAGAVWMQAGNIERCTLLANFTSGGGAGIVANNGTVRRVILTGNMGGSTCGGIPGATWTCSNLFANEAGDGPCGVDGGGNFSADPQFCAVDPATSLNVSLQQDSPCAPGNHPNGDTCDLIGSGAVACAAVAVRPMTWSGYKILYR